MATNAFSQQDPNLFRTISSIMYEILINLQRLISALSNDKFISNNSIHFFTKGGVLFVLTGFVRTGFVLTGFRSDGIRSDGISF